MMESWLQTARDPDLASAAADLKEQLRAATTRQVEALANASNVDLPLSARTVASALIALDDGFALQELLDPGATDEMLWDVVDYFTATLGAVELVRTGAYAASGNAPDPSVQDDPV